MSDRKKHIIALLLILLPFYLTAFLQKLFFNQSDYMVHEFLGLFMLLGVVGIAVVLFINSALLKQSWKVFASGQGSVLQDLSIGLFLCGIYYFIEVLSWNTYGDWIPKTVDRTHVRQLMTEIFDNPYYALLMIGPFNWVNEVFSVLSIVFIINNLETILKLKYRFWLIIIFSAGLFSLLQIDLGPKEMLDSFIVIAVFSYTYLKYKRIYPLLLAAILVQTLDMVVFWMKF